MDKAAEALRMMQTAKQYCTRGLHVQAADLFHQASLLYTELGMIRLAGYCDGSEEAERRQMRPTMPVNRAALVD